MSHGAAANRLRRLVLFDLLRKHDENWCFKCGELIKSAGELSVEHKEPWEGRSTELFWDLNNIAFSHTSCNVPHTRRGGEPKRKTAINGMAWCTGHQRFEPVVNFNAEKARWNGLQHYCKNSRLDR